MIYLLVILYVIIYTSIIKVERNKKLDFFIAYFPIFLIFILVISLQSNVGTDYQSYLDIASGDKSIEWFLNKKEYLFIFIVKITRWFQNPQLIFLLVGIIQMIFLFLISEYIYSKGYSLSIFYIFYFIMSIALFNQLNGIRQYISIYIIVYSLLLFIDKKITKSAIFIILASLFHKSSIYFLLIFIFYPIINKNINIKYLFIILLITIIFAFIITPENYELLFKNTSYITYIGSEFNTKYSLRTIIPKLPRIVIYLSSLIIIKKKNVSNYENKLVNLSFIGIIFMILSFTSSLWWRFYLYFDIVLIFPLIILYNKKFKFKNIYYRSIILILFIILILKILIFPEAEYKYRSILYINSSIERWLS